MKPITKCFTALLVAGAVSFSLSAVAQEAEGIHPHSTGSNVDQSVKIKGERTICIVEDRDQNYMTSKVYELKHAKANDLRVFVEGAVKRYDDESSVARMNYKSAGRQLLIVNMPTAMVPYIDEMVKVLDRESIKDERGSTLEGTGIYRFSYTPKYRSTSDMLKILVDRFGCTKEGGYFRDAGTNMFYWKDSKSDGNGAIPWLKALDRPIPQVAMKITIYEVNNNDLKELGIDYVNWKNGPGAELFSIGADILSFSANEEILTSALNLVSASQYAWGGWMFAPSFDASFLRLLAQKGKAKVATSGVINVTNSSVDPGTVFDDAKFNITMSPQFQNIKKDDSQEIGLSGGSDVEYKFHLRQPTICFNDAASEAAVVTFGYVLSSGSVVEHTNSGIEVVNSEKLQSYLTLSTGAEKVIGTFNRVHDVEQYNGMPFLGDIPVIKYLFGSTSHSKSLTRYIVTISADPVTSESNLSEWAGKIVEDAEEIIKKEQ